MEYTALMKDPRLEPLWKIGFGNELGRLFQGIHDTQGPNTCFFVELTNIPKDHQITYEKKSVIINLTKRRNNGSDSQWAAIYLIILAKWQPQRRTSQV
jgi:hypothetical protein